MSDNTWRPAREDGLSHTTLRIGRGLPASSVAEVVRALQRVPGVLTVDGDAENAQAFVAHDAGVPIAALVAAANQGGTTAKNVIATCGAAAPLETAAPRTMQRRQHVAAVGIAAMLAVILIDFSLPNNPEKRWLFIIPVVLLWAFMLLRAARARRS